MNRAVERLALLGFALPLLLAVPASAWEPIYPTRPVWRLPVPYSLHQAGSPDIGGFSGTEPEVRRGMDDWTTVSCTSLTTSYRGMTSSVPGSYEGVSVIGWIESGWRHGSSAIGVTGPRWGSNIIESDMEMNGVNFTWTTGSGSGSRVNAYSIVLHEGGHYYGLGHSNVRGSSMWPSYGGGIIGLGPDDNAGICALYPGSGSSDCTTTGCPSGQECVSGVCQTITGDGTNCSPCARSSECASNAYCVGYPDGGGYCATTCRSDADCAGDRCVNTSGGPLCVRFSGSTPSCTVAPSGCTNDSQCAPTEICSGGDCVPRPATGSPLGEACTADDGCRSGLCLAGVCTQSCDWLNTTSCPSGFYCDGDSSTSCSTGYCLRGTAGAGALGDSCTGDTECSSLFCDGGTCTTPCVPGGTVGCSAGYTCQVGTLTCRGACRRGRELGDSCEVNSDCASLACAMRGSDSFCTQACNDTTTCPDGFSCLAAGDQSVCVPDAGGLDDACTTDADCLSGICTTEHGGSYCTRACGECPAGFECQATETDAAVCVRTERELGQDCDGNEDCASRLCATHGGEMYCTELCTDGMCPSGYECAVAGDTSVCRAMPGSRPMPRGGCGCRVGGASGLGLGGPLLFALLLLAGARLRARGRATRPS